MSLECPNCRESVSFFRSFRTTAWGSFRCKACGSVLGISFPRRMIAVGIWTGVLLLSMGVLRLSAWGPLWSYSAMGVMFVAIFYLCEKIVLLDRRAFTCKRCGYDLRGLIETRCPECGTDFDPAERERIVARMASPAPKPRYRWIVPFVVVLLAFSVVAGLDFWRRAAGATAGRAAAPTTQQGPTTPKGDK